MYKGFFGFMVELEGTKFRLLYALIRSKMTDFR